MVGELGAQLTVGRLQGRSCRFEGKSGNADQRIPPVDPYDVPLSPSKGRRGRGLIRLAGLSYRHTPFHLPGREDSELHLKTPLYGSWVGWWKRQHNFCEDV